MERAVWQAILASHIENDNSFELQVIRAAHKLHYEGRYVGNPMLASCAEVMLKDFDIDKPIEGCSNGALSFSFYVPA